MQASPSVSQRTAEVTPRPPASTSIWMQPGRRGQQQQRQSHRHRRKLQRRDPLVRPINRECGESVAIWDCMVKCGSQTNGEWVTGAVCRRGKKCCAACVCTTLYYVGDVCGPTHVNLDRLTPLPLAASDPSPPPDLVTTTPTPCCSGMTRRWRSRTYVHPGTGYG